MCYGMQQYYTHCRHPGNFIVNDRCYMNPCETRLEIDSSNILGYCRNCLTARANGQPITHDPQNPPRSPSHFTSAQEIENHFLPRLYAAAAELNVTKMIFDSEMKRNRESPRYLHARGMYRSAEATYQSLWRNYHREVINFSADEVASVDLQGLTWAEGDGGQGEQGEQSERSGEGGRRR